MSLSNKARDEFNLRLKLVDFPMEVLELIFWRPVFQNSHFQDYEPLNDVSRLFQCDPVYITFFFQYDGRQYEYELHYLNHDKSLKLDSFKLNYAQYGLDENVSKIEDNMRHLIGLIAATTIPGILEYLHDSEKKEGD